MTETTTPGRQSATVWRNDRRHRYELTVDGEPAGHAAYRDRDRQRIFYHTEVDDRLRGQGLGTRLVAEALADARDAGMRIVAVCPLVAAYVAKHPEYGDLTDPATRKH